MAAKRGSPPAARAAALDRVGKLMALALDASASEHEARNAAMQAVRLIAQHGLMNAKAAPAREPKIPKSSAEAWASLVKLTLEYADFRARVRDAELDLHNELDKVKNENVSLRREAQRLNDALMRNLRGG